MENNTYFPPNQTNSGVLHRYQSDFTIRDHFAALAMQGMITNARDYEVTKIPKMAYQFADAMMKARKL